MKLHDLQVDQRFTFIGKHRGKVFEVTDASRIHIAYMDVATGEHRTTTDNRKTFRMGVRPITKNRLIELTPDECKFLDEVFYGAWLIADNEQAKEDIDKFHAKLTGLPGRRVVLPDDPNGGVKLRGWKK